MNFIGEDFSSVLKINLKTFILNLNPFVNLPMFQIVASVCTGNFTQF